MRLYKLAAEQGNARAQYKLGWMYEQGLGDLERDGREAVRLYKLAAEQGHSNAMRILAYIYDRSKILPLDGEKSAEYIMKSAAAGALWVKEQVLNDALRSWHRNTRLAFQKYLFKKGYYNGAIDGKVGPDTKKALKKYLKSKN